MLLPILNEDLKIIATVKFEDNLTLEHVPQYVNQNGRLGLKRLDESYGSLEDSIVYMFYDPENPKTSYAEIITDKEAYKYCLNRGKLDLAEELGLQYVDGVEVL